MVNHGKKTDELDVRAILNIASSRLGDTIKFYAAARAVSDHCSETISPSLFKYVNSSPFWRSTYGAFQTSLFINVFALVDKRTDCASFFNAARLLDIKKAGLITNDLLGEIEHIYKLYAPFRNKIFAHTDHQWLNFEDEFDATFTWNSILDDIQMLDYICQTLVAVLHETKIPSKEDAKANFSFAKIEATAIKIDAMKLFGLIQNNLDDDALK